MVWDKMKKYVKPDFYFENFQLSNYASGCAVTPITTNANSENACVFDLGGGITVFNIPDVCGKSTVPPEEYCYQNGSGMTIAWS